MGRGLVSEESKTYKNNLVCVWWDDNHKYLQRKQNKQSAHITWGMRNANANSKPLFDLVQHNIKHLICSRHWASCQGWGGGGNKNHQNIIPVLQEFTTAHIKINVIGKEQNTHTQKQKTALKTGSLLLRSLKLGPPYIWWCGWGRV